MDHLSEQTLIEESRAGSRVAFDALMQRYQRLVFRVSYTYARNTDDAMDVTQDVFLKAYTKLGSYRGTGTFRAWLLKIAHRENLNRLRGRRRHATLDELGPGDVPAYPAAQERALVDAERREALLDALADINPRQRQAVVLRYVEGLPIASIATTLECSEGVAKNILFRSLKKLRERMVRRWRRNHEHVPAL